MMLSWRKVMVVFIVFTTFLAVLLGYLGDPAHLSLSLLRPGGAPVEHGPDDETAGAGSCPWQLEVVTMGHDDNISGRTFSSVFMRTNGS